MCCLDSGNAKTLTVDGSESQIVLPNLTPGVTYEVTVVALKGQRESEPGSDSVTTGTTTSKMATHTIIIVKLHIKMYILPGFCGTAVICVRVYYSSG